MGTPAFDPAQYKEGIRQKWQKIAERRHTWMPFISSRLRPATELIIDPADVGMGRRVLDLAAGNGDRLDRTSLSSRAEWSILLKHFRNRP